MQFGRQNDTKKKNGSFCFLNLAIRVSWRLSGKLKNLPAKCSRHGFDPQSGRYYMLQSN